MFTSYAASIADLKKQLKKVPANKRAALNRQISLLNQKRADQNKKICSKLKKPSPLPTATPTPTVAPFSSLGKIPSASKLVQAVTQINSLSVSGQPPALKDIPGGDVKPLYWQGNIISNINNSTANPYECSDFWWGDQDGDSGGMNACNMTAQLGYTFSPIMSAGVSLCRLQGLPKPELFLSGAIQPVGPMPIPSSPEALFDAPDTAKTIKLDMTGSKPALMFVKIYSKAENAQQNYQFHADIWQCGGQSNEAVLRHSIVVNNDNQYLYGFYSHEDNLGSGGHQFTVDATLALDENGAPRFDLTKDRHAVAEHRAPSGTTFGFRQDIRITPENLLKIKSRWLFDYGWRTDYIVSSFSGTGIQDLRLREGAIKARDHNDGEPVSDSSTAVEYRDIAYVAAPANSLVTQVSSVDFDTDSFFANPPSVQIDTSSFHCDVTPDMAFQINTDNPAVAQMLSSCEDYTIWDTNFCAQDPLINQAKTQWSNYCPSVLQG